MSQLDALKAYLKEKGKLVVAFSGGVDSTFLLKAAHGVLGDNVIAVTVKSCLFPEREICEAEAFCEKENVRHVILESDELAIEGFSKNPPDRCYICKKDLFTKILRMAEEEKIPYVAEASNLDDNGDYRPGLRAVEELKVLSPLRAVGMDKRTIRELSRELGLPTWSKQSFACLASRFVYGEEITREKLHMVDLAEQYLLDEGFHQVRVRIHGSDKGTIARIEIGAEEFAHMMAEKRAEKTNARLKEIGFSYVTLDPGGYRMGSMNDSVLAKEVQENSEQTPK